MSYLLFNNLKFWKQTRGRRETRNGLVLTYNVNANRTYLEVASRLMGEFDLVGDTYALGDFWAEVESMLQWEHEPVKHANPSRDGAYGSRFVQANRRAIQENAGLDVELYARWGPTHNRTRSALRR